MKQDWKLIGIIVGCMAGTIGLFYVFGLFAQFIDYAWVMRYAVMSPEKYDVPKVSFGFFDCILATFSSTGLKGIIAIFAIILIVALLNIDRIEKWRRNRKNGRGFERSESNSHGSANELSFNDIKERFEVSTVDESKGIILGEIRDKLVCLPRDKKGNKNIAVIGSSGTGKSRAVIRNALFQMMINGESVVLTDPKGELYADTAYLFALYGYEIKVLNLVDIEKSDGWNPMEDVIKHPEKATVLAKSLIINTSTANGGDKFWDDVAENLLKGLILWVALDENLTSAEKNLATIAIVGENMKHTPGIAGKLFGTLGRNGISVIACAQGASETNISFVVEEKFLKKSLNVIHDSFFLSEYQVLNLFICGTGTVGDSLIKQLASQQEKLMKERGLKLNVVGIANGHQALFDRDGLDLSNYRQLLDEKGTASSPQIIRDEVIGMNIFNSVFVDCTANADVASLYKDLLNNNVSVVAANKIAASSSYANYTELKRIARNRGVKYLFETNVGAGLPIIKTINDLIASGDKILKIEAVVSGTLNFIFNKISADVPFSETIRLAKEQGYSEPDPRIDLSGKDVIRKLVILAREAGYVLEQEDVEKNLFVPDEFFEGSLEDFWKNIPSLDADFEARRQKLEAENKHWKFVAKLEDGKGSVSLQEVSRSHPFYGLEGSNNIVLLTTERYNEYPMMIQGYGAGASVTAAGVFADIISVANI